MFAVEFRGVSKVYGRAAGGRVDALVDATFQVGAGETAVVSGPSGAGKSTLLRLVYGEERATRGSVLVDGVDIATLDRAGLARLRRRLGVVPEDGRLLADRTVFGNVAFVLRALGVPRAEVRPHAIEALREAGLSQKLNALPPELAHGERWRLLLARALAPTPGLLLVDEPPDTRVDAGGEEILGLLRAARGRGLTVLLTARSPELAPRLDARSLRLDGGRLRREGDSG